MSEEIYPPVAFYFTLSIASEMEETKISFQEVSGLSSEIKTSEIVEGGENQFVHRLPNTTKFSNLVFKRGIVNQDAAIAKWCLDTLDGGFSNPIQPKDLIVQLLNEQGAPSMSWHFSKAWPVKWSIGNFDAMKNEIVVETLEFSYQHFERVTA